jgi:hypothetical protein
MGKLKDLIVGMEKIGSNVSIVLVRINKNK